jgi:hypothetical protein
MIVDRMKFFGDIFYPILGDSSQCASVGWRAEMYRLVSSGTTTIFMPRILARFETSSVIDRRRLSVATSALSAGMRTGGRPDVAVDAGMIIGVEPSGALRTVIGTITETLPLLRHCSRGCAQQQPHCHDKFCYAHD